jgi:hypothetical protein
MWFWIPIKSDGSQDEKKLTIVRSFHKFERHPDPAKDVSDMLRMLMKNL